MLSLGQIGMECAFKMMRLFVSYVGSTFNFKHQDHRFFARFTTFDCFIKIARTFCQALCAFDKFYTAFHISTIDIRNVVALDQ